MKKFTLVLACLAIQLSYSQVSIHKNRLVKNETEYKFSKYQEVFSNTEAKAYFKKARANKTAADIFAFAGGFGIGFGLVQAITGGSSEYTDLAKKHSRKQGWTIAGIGTGVSLISIPLMISSKKNAEKAIQVENGETTAFQPYYKLEATGNGIVLTYNF